jgi:protein SCO1/2
MNPSPSTFLAILFLLSGCGPSPREDDAYTTHPATGVIRELPSDGKSVVIRHDEIPGVMPKMTMALNVRDPGSLTGFREGDEVRFRLHIGTNEHWIDSIQWVGHNVDTDSAKTFSRPGDELKLGDPMPDFDWRGEEGQIRRLAEHRGSSVALTFIFTRCPLPEFCPRMTRNFSEARQLLLDRDTKSTNWLLLSLSFDPDFDTPSVLKHYAEASRGTNADHWTFGALASNTVSRLAPALDLRVVPDGGGFSHNLRTVVIDSEGRIHRQFDGNRWTPAQLADALIEAIHQP